MAPDTRLPLQNGIAYDAEHYILDAQHGPRWASEDQDMDRKLTELREEHGTPPNIIYSEAIHSEALRRRRDAHSNFFAEGLLPTQRRVRRIDMRTSGGRNVQDKASAAIGP